MKCVEIKCLSKNKTNQKFNLKLNQFDTSKKSKAEAKSVDQKYY